MHGLTTDPDLNARDRRPSRRMAGYLLLTCGIVGGALLALPAHYNPLVLFGILAQSEAPDDAPIAMIAMTIPVRASDLPAQRPSLSAARSVDRIEAAHIAGVPPLAAGVIVEVDETTSEAVAAPIEPAAIAVSTPAAALPLPKRSSPSAHAPPELPRVPSGASGPNEDFTELKKRAFNAER